VLVVSSVVDEALGGAAVALLGLLVAWASLQRRRLNALHDAVGEKNGNGSTNEMLAKLLGIGAESLSWQQHHDRRDDDRFDRLDERLEAIEHRPHNGRADDGGT